MPAPLQPRALRKLSLVFPIYNEEETLPYLRAEIERWMRDFNTKRPEATVEIILVDDGSTDNSLQQLIAWHEDEPRLRVLAFSRNFGHQAASTAGLREATGDAAVLLDADLQAPLDVLHTMIDRYEEGYDVAYGQRTSRPGESEFKLGTAWLFYRIMRAFVYRDMPADAGDFRLVSRACLDAVNAMPESHRFLRGLFAWSGFAQIAVPYERAARMHGTTKYPLHKMVNLAWNAITSFSTLPMRFIGACGAMVALFGFVYSLFAVFEHFTGETVTGWTTLICLLCLLGGMILIGLGVIGEYVGRIYDEVKQRPGYIVQTRYGKSSHDGTA